ncbi:MAG: GIY-YIG nuclease family protein, partial [Acidimicrobiales bacterium]
TGLDDLLSLPKLAGHPQVAKLALTDSLPRAPGVYLFRDVNGQVLYVGKASNLRQRVRSYFSGDHRRKVPQMLRETHRIDHRRCVNDLEAAVSEIRLIQVHQPRFNSQLKRWKRYTYLKLTTERFPRLSITKQVRDDAAIYLGPLSSTAAARQVAEAIETAVPIRRCTARPGANPRSAPCAAAQLGVATCPCAGAVTESEYAPLVDRVVAGITSEPALLLEPLATKMHELARAERYEEAADMRDRAAALASALERRRSVERLRSTGHLLIELADGGVALRDGHFLAAWSGPRPPDPLPGFEPALPPAQLDGPRTVPGRDEIDELLAVARWLDANTARIRIVGGNLTVTEQPEPLPRFRPAGTTLSATSRHR